MAMVVGSCSGHLVEDVLLLVYMRSDLHQPCGVELDVLPHVLLEMIGLVLEQY
jgi:hypothetical protein